MTTKQLAIIDAACEVAAFSKTNAYPQEGTPSFFVFAQKLDALATAINAEYPNFNRNVRMGGANVAVSHAPCNLPQTSTLNEKPDGYGRWL